MHNSCFSHHNSERITGRKHNSPSPPPPIYATYNETGRLLDGTGLKFKVDVL